MSSATFATISKERYPTVVLASVHLRIVALATSVLLMLALSAATARADFGVAPGTYSASLSSAQAGGHPDLTISFAFNVTGTTPDEVPDGNVRSVLVKLPAGLVGDPQAVPQCSADILAADAACPADTQVGVITYTLGGIPFNPTFSGITAPVYNMVPRGNHPAEFAFLNRFVALVKVPIVTAVRPSDGYRINSLVPQISANLKIFASSITLWGVPADPSHDGERGISAVGGCLGDFGPTGSLCPSGLQPKPFLSNPPQCLPGEPISMTADSWQNPGAFLPTLLSSPFTMFGCAGLRFEPGLSVQPQTRKAGSPAGYTVTLRVPQNDSASDLATPHLKTAVVTLPEGVRISPSAANGLQGCSDAQIGLHTDADVACPAGSKIGTVTVHTPLLPDPLVGAVYQGTQTSTQLVRIFIVVKGPGIIIKLPGAVSLDKSTGRISTTFDNNPQLPFEEFVLKFKGGPTAPLVNPRTCGTKTTDATLTSWAGNVVHTTDSFEVSKDGNGAPCGRSTFSPSFEAGSDNPVARAAATFTVRFSRTDDDQELKGVTVSTPPGLLAHIADVPLCPRANAAAGTCPAASQIGTVTTGAGPGPQPLYLPGRVYITGPYKGGPFGMSIVVPAKAGPLDLGNVVVRASIAVRNDGSLRVVSDPLPSILMGIPLQVRSVSVSIDRDGFMLNPTNCDPLRVSGQLVSLDGAIANVGSRFQVGECDRLPFKPKITLTIGRKGHTRRGTSSPLTATLTQGPGQAGIKGTKVVLPLTLSALLPVVTNACTLVEYQAGHCAKAKAGTATAVTPLLKHALRGGVFFVKDPNKAPGSLPNLMVALRGQVDIDLVGKIKIPSAGNLATDFNTVPDVPLKRFTLSLVDGSHGPLAVAENLCAPKAKHAKARVTFRGQNGKVIHTSQPLKVNGCGRSGKPKH